MILRPLIALTTTHRSLLWTFACREFNQRHHGTMLGWMWPVLQPLATLGMYTVVFGLVLKARWPQRPDQGLADVALVMFTGMAAFQCLGESLARAPGVIVAVPNLVKKVVFPLEILPAALVISVLMHTGIALALIVVVQALLHGNVHPTALLAPVVLLPMFLLALGAAWIASSLGVYLRDLGQVTGLMVQALFFSAPIVYPAESMPAGLRAICTALPHAQVVEDLRRVLLWGQMPDWNHLIIAFAWGAATALIGGWWFNHARQGFPDAV